MPIGSIIVWNNSAAIPNDYLVCDGSRFDAAVYPKLNRILGSNKLPNMNTSLKANIDGYYVTGEALNNSYNWGHSGKHSIVYETYEIGGGHDTWHKRRRVLSFNSFSDGLTYNWNIKWIIKAK